MYGSGLGGFFQGSHITDSGGTVLEAVAFSNVEDDELISILLG